MSKEQPGGPRKQGELSKQGEKELRAGRGRGRWGLWALGEDWAFTHKEVGAVEGCGQRRGGA